LAKDKELAAEVEKIKLQAGAADEVWQLWEEIVKKEIIGEANISLYKSLFQTSTCHPLKLSMILDSGTTIHIFNHLLRFINFCKAPYHHILITGNHKVPILRYHDIHIELKRPRGGKGTLQLRNTAFCTDFATNLVSFRLL
jgi:hypothetical protein